MTALDTSARALSVKLLDKFGKSITLQSIVEGAYDPVTGDMAANTVTTSYPLAVVGDFKGLALASGVIQYGDRKVTIAASGSVLPLPTDKVIIDTETYNVISVKSIWSGELAALYELQVRK
jgi:hypothetical protein